MKNIFVLPFDHRANFAKKLFNVDEPYDAETIKKVADLKRVIYDAIFKSIQRGIPMDETAVLCDEVFGSEILKDANAKHLQIMQTLEKSGKDELMLEYGDDYLTHLKSYNATFAKVLVRYNVEDEDKEKNQRQLKLLKKVSDEVHAAGIKLLIEPLIPATSKQFEKIIMAANEEEKKKIFDMNMRGALCAQMIKEMQDMGIECDVWKIEGFYNRSDYELVSAQARNSEWRKQNVGIIILGRNETHENVEKWINAGKSVEGVVGFAVGRTIFWDTIVALNENRINRETAVNTIANEFYKFYLTFKSKNSYWRGHAASLITDLFLVILVACAALLFIK